MDRHQVRRDRPRILAGEDANASHHPVVVHRPDERRQVGLRPGQGAGAVRSDAVKSSGMHVPTQT